MTVFRARSLTAALLVSVVMFFGCGTSPAQKKVTHGSRVTVEYTLRADGQAAFPENQPEHMIVVVGQGLYPAKFERELLDLAVGSKKEITLSPEEGFGLINKELIVRVPKSQFPEGMDLRAGMVLKGPSDDKGRPVASRVIKILDDSVILDRNHPLAGKQLIYRVQVTVIESGGGTR